MEHLDADPNLGRRLNESYVNNLVWKNQSQGNDRVDQKRVFDLSEERLKIIHEADPEVFAGEMTGLFRVGRC